MGVRVVKGTIALILACVLFADSVPGSWRLDDYLGRQKLHELNEAFLDEAGHEAFETFMLLSILKAGLAVMSSSSAGISFIVDMDVQVGQLISSSKEIVDTGWLVSIAGIAVIKGIRMVLDILDTYAAFFLQGAVFFLMLYALISLFWETVSTWLVACIRAALIFTLFFSFGIPWAVGGMALVSKVIIHPRGQEVRKELHERHGHLKVDHDRNLKQQAHKSLKKYQDKAESLETAHKHLAEQIIDHIVLVLFDAVIFPFLFVAFAFVFVRWTSWRLVELFLKGDASLQTSRQMFPVLAKSLE